MNHLHNQKKEIPPEQDADGNDIKGSGEKAMQEAVQHYPNGINLTHLPSKKYSISIDLDMYKE